MNDITKLRDAINVTRQRIAELTADERAAMEATDAAKIRHMAGTGDADAIAEAQARSRAIADTLDALEKVLSEQTAHLAKARDERSRSEALERAQEIAVTLAAAHEVQESLWYEAEAFMSAIVGDILSQRDKIARLQQEFETLRVPDFAYGSDEKRAVDEARAGVNAPIKTPFDVQSVGVAHGVQAAFWSEIAARERAAEKARRQVTRERLAGKPTSNGFNVVGVAEESRDGDPDFAATGYYQQIKEAQTK